MAGSKLDPIDRHILAELQDDGRMTNVELARRVGISAPPCLRRVRTLEEAGYIRGYHADIDARELGFEVAVFAMVRLTSQAEADLSAFEARCRAWPLVRECHMLNGEIDFILKLVARDLHRQRYLFERFMQGFDVFLTPTLAKPPAPHGEFQLRGLDQIAATLAIGRRTVETHIATIYGKLGVHGRAEAVAFSVRQGIV